MFRSSEGVAAKLAKFNNSSENEDESWGNFQEFKIPSQLMRPQWRYRSSHEKEEVVKMRIKRTEGIVQNLQGWKMPQDRKRDRSKKNEVSRTVQVAKVRADNLDTFYKQLDTQSNRMKFQHPIVKNPVYVTPTGARFPVTVPRLIAPAPPKIAVRVPIPTLTPAPVIASTSAKLINPNNLGKLVKVVDDKGKIYNVVENKTTSVEGAGVIKIPEGIIVTPVAPPKLTPANPANNNTNRKKLQVAAAKVLDLTQNCPLPLFNQLYTKGNKSYQEIVQKMAAQGKLVLANGKLVVREEPLGALPALPTLAPKPSTVPDNKSVTYTLAQPELRVQEEMETGGTIPPPPRTYGPSTSTVRTSIDSDGFLVPDSRAMRTRKQTIERVDPASVLPVTVSSGSSVSSSESDDLLEFPTDEYESETENIKNATTTNTILFVPHTKVARKSVPSPNSNDLHDLELEEPELLVGSNLDDEATPPKRKKAKHEPQPHTDGKIYPKPAFSYSCLIAMSLKNSKTGSLPVSEIYKFMCDHFPYFKSAPSGWKNSVRHNLSLNKCFEKIEKPGNGARKGCLWALNPAKIDKMDDEVQKWSKKDPMAIKIAMSDPENLGLLERGELKRDYSGLGSDDDEEDDTFPSTPHPARSRGSSTDSTGAETMMSTTTPTTKISHVVAVSRPSEQKIHIKSEPKDSIDLSTITSVQGNYICQTGSGPYISFATLSNATTPIIIRRTTVK